ncbi:hypothetical protein An15g01570 [Aspergillus niger]|uniref:Uncharacterized protein n=2 Tax=Aspergillus niger TaxID=5061 RepID=A2R4T9_ASPNC|nr:hypothetical protein An15g01570 [Aspergillus niger]CAL00971.1 hypothetical protein An15g01570 [Aspergillus niger]
MGSTFILNGIATKRKHLLIMAGTRLLQRVALGIVHIAGDDQIYTDYQDDSFAAAWAIQSSILSVATMEVLSNKVVLTYITKQAPRSHGSGGPHDYVVTGGRDLLSLRNHHFADRR